MTRKIIFTVFAILFFSIQLDSQSTAENPKPTIKIGAVLSLSGNARQWGINARNGMNLALEEINADGGINGRPLEIIFKDSKTDEATAAKEFQELIKTEKVQVVIGDIASSTTLSMYPIAQQNKIVLFSPGASSPKLSISSDFFFRNWHSDKDEGKKIVSYIFDNLKANKVALFYIDNEYGKGFNDIFIEEFNERKRKILRVDNFSSVSKGGGDFRKKIAEILLVEPDVILLVGYEDEIKQIFKQLGEISKDKPLPQIISTQAFNNANLLNEKAAEGVVFSVPRLPDLSNVTVKNFRDKYQQTYREDIYEKPADYSEAGYDAVKIIANVLKQLTNEQKELSGEAIREKLPKIKNFEGASGIINFNEYGDVNREFSFKQVRNGKFEIIGSNNSQPQTPQEEKSKDWSTWIWDFLNAPVIVAIIGGLLAITGAIFYFFVIKVEKANYWFWKRYWWYRMDLWLRRKTGKVSQYRLTTLDIYVILLEWQRKIITNKCHRIDTPDTKRKPKITVYIFTKQLPRNWHLWGDEDADLRYDITPLEKYFKHFKQFLTDCSSKELEVKLKRVIIIDSCESPNGKERKTQLTEDVKSDYFEKYLDNLHNKSDEAFVYYHKRPFPSWLSDAVFYAITTHYVSQEWLWGISTSFDTGEDLITLEMFKLFGKKKERRLPFSDIETLEELASKMDTMPLTKLSELKNNSSE